MWRSWPPPNDGPHVELQTIDWFVLFALSYWVDCVYSLDWIKKHLDPTRYCPELFQSIDVKLPNIYDYPWAFIVVSVFEWPSHFEWKSLIWMEIFNLVNFRWKDSVPVPKLPPFVWQLLTKLFILPAFLEEYLVLFTSVCLDIFCFLLIKIR